VSFRLPKRFFPVLPKLRNNRDSYKQYLFDGFFDLFWNFGVLAVFFLVFAGFAAI